MAEKAYETRTVTADFEMRGDASAPTLEGYAATFNQEYDLGPFRERIDTRAFDKTLSLNPDVRLLIDHEGQPLARTKSGTLSLTPDSTGLHVRASLEPTDPDVQRLMPKMRRGDLDQMSFAFRVPTGGDSWENDYTLRTIREINLSGGDVSVVTYPANPATSVAIRARDEREARCVFAEAIIREIRAGKTVSAANMARLQTILTALAAADDHLDAAEAAVAEIVGVADPDNDAADDSATDDMMQANSGRPLGLALAVAQRLGIPA